MTDNDRVMEVPGDEDENVGDLPKKKIKKKKTKEEREADRKVVFWTLLIILGITLCFWVWPLLRDFEFGLPSFGSDSSETEIVNTDEQKTDKKNYIEYKL